MAYLGAFNPASVGTNQAADIGFQAITAPGNSGVFSVSVPAGATLTVVVVELKSPGNGFPTAFGSTYTLRVAGLPVALAAPTAASVSVSGKVSAAGRGVGYATVRIVDDRGNVRSALTNPFGYFRFYGLEAGKTYFVFVDHKRYTFSPRVITLYDSLADLNFQAE